MKSEEKKAEAEKLLELSKKEQNVKQKLRYDTALLYLEGRQPKDISAYLHIPQRTVSYHIGKYKKGGIEALVLRTAPGAQKKLTDEQEEQLLQTVSDCTPEEAGIGIFANWTAGLVCEWVRQQFGVEYSESGMRDLLHRIGLSYTRPTYTLKKADPEKKKAFKERFEALKKTAEP